MILTIILSSMPFSAPSSVLVELGLNEAESLVYSLLLEKGRSTAQELLKPSGLGRGNLYNSLSSLIKKGLCFEIEGKKTVYEPSPPSMLSSLLQEEKDRVHQLQGAFDGLLPILQSQYTKALRKPVIRIFEGLAGTEEALFDSLQSQGEILTFLDPAAMVEEFAKINERYIRRRVEKKIPKRILLPAGEASLTYQKKMSFAYTSIRITEHLSEGFRTAMELYNDTLAYHTLSKEKPISVLITDPNIVSLQKAEFEAIWATAH